MLRQIIVSVHNQIVPIELPAKYLEDVAGIGRRAAVMPEEADRTLHLHQLIWFFVVYVSVHCNSARPLTRESTSQRFSATKGVCHQNLRFHTS